MDEFKNNKEGKIGELKVRFLVYLFVSFFFWPELRIRLSATPGGYLEAEGRTAETCRRRQDPAEGGADCYPRTWFVPPPYLIGVKTD
jgi:hypothetical protein